MTGTHHKLLPPERSMKFGARRLGLVEGVCLCGYRSAPSDEKSAQRAAEDHYEAVMSHRWLWVVRCPYCAEKAVSTSRSGAFLMWFGHWAKSVNDGAHPNPPDTPTDDMYEGIRLSKRHVELMGKDR